MNLPTNKGSPIVTDRLQLDLADYLPYLINRLGGALVANMIETTLAPYDLTIDMWRLLAVLSYRGAQRQVDLVDMTSIEASTVSRLVTRLARMGLVTRRRSTTSNREVVIELTAKGRGQVDRIIPSALKLEQMAAAGVSAKDLALVKRALRRMYQNMSQQEG
jgi:DNA-binding MarR family transcriptional regulator